MFAVDDIDDTITWLSALGATVVGRIVDDEHRYRRRYIRSHEGVVIGRPEQLSQHNAERIPPNKGREWSADRPRDGAVGRATPRRLRSRERVDAMSHVIAMMPMSLGGVRGFDRLADTPEMLGVATVIRGVGVMDPRCP
jgi:hypothetical protein